MLLIHTDNFLERQALQQQFRTQNGVINMPVKQCETLSGMIKSITYQYFHKEPPALALKIQEYIGRSLKMHHSLQLYRVIMRSIKDYEQRLHLYQQYIFKMNQALNEENCQAQLQQSIQGAQNVDQLFELSLLRQNHSSSILQIIDVPMLPFESVKSHAFNQQLQSQITKNSNTPSSNQCIKQTLESINKINNFFYSASAIYNRDDWKTERSVKKQDKQGSKEIDSFQKKGESIVDANSSLQNLLADQMSYDIKRTLQQSAPKHKQSKRMQKTYAKTIKDALLFSKITLRKKK